MKNLINPFRYLAGGKALALGVIFIVSSALLLYSCRMIQDSYIHLAPSNDAIWSVLLWQVLWWLVPALLLYACGLLLSHSRIRIIDVLGTTAFSQLIMLLLITPMLIPAVRDSSSNVLEAVKVATEPMANDLLCLMIYGFWSLAMIVLFFVWNYNAFATSCNVRGWKAITSFIAVQILMTVIGTFI